MRLKKTHPSRLTCNGDKFIHALNMHSKLISTAKVQCHSPNARLLDARQFLREYDSRLQSHLKLLNIRRSSVHKEYYAN